MEQAKTGLVFDFHRGTTHDGPGMRTTVFLKGCPLHCQWCHNPESIDPRPHVQWDKKKCIGCRQCLELCPPGAVTEGEKGFVIHQDLCREDHRFVENCPTTAMSMVGIPWEVRPLVKQACKDKMFFGEFEGGVTVSGGEPTYQADFLLEFVKALKEEGVHVALDTCGFARRSVYEALLPYVDVFLYDMKLMDCEDHKRFTGVPNELILDNLSFLAEEIRKNRKNKMWIRTPLIPGATATEKNIRGIGAYIQEHLLDVIDRWELCAFNNVCKDKYEKLDKDWVYKDEKLMTVETVNYLGELARTYAGDLVVVSGLTRKEE